jgi:uncharacterized protein (TIGR00730 family)
MNSIAVFCGSAIGVQPRFEQQAYALGRLLAEQNITLVYGGASIGLMGAVANGALQHKGTVIGVIPHFLNSKEIAHPNITELISVDSMHARKTKMNELCDAVIALPGGFGTMDELFEMLTWAQLGLHQKPIGILNIDGFYNPLVDLLQHMTQLGFLPSINLKMLLVEQDLELLLTRMRTYMPPPIPQWLQTGKE